jgi:hypothetical protein
VTPPIPTPILRFIHIDNLPVYMQRRALHAPNHLPQNGLAYKTIHNVEIQQVRRRREIPCGPGGVIHDYVSFYLGPRSPMLFQLHTGWNIDYREGQEPLIYLMSTAQRIRQNGARFVFSDGHGIASFTRWFDDLEDLDKLDWDTIYANIWKDTVDDMDRQRRKQAEFLVHRQCDWGLIEKIAVINDRMKARVEEIQTS